MPETIAMTPDGSVEWEIHDICGGKLLLPGSPVGAEVDTLLTSPRDIRRDHREIGSGSMAKVYEAWFGMQALRLINNGAHGVWHMRQRPFSEHPHLAWLRSNIMIAQAFRLRPKLVGEGLRVLSPIYLGSFISEEYSYFLMNNCLQGRRKGCIDSQDDINLAFDVSSGLSAQIRDMYGGPFQVYPDTVPKDILIGEDDVVMVDANGGRHLNF